MKAFLLAGGVGSRLRPLTETTPKCLLPIRGIPMLQIWFELFRRYGISEVLINLHHHGKIVHSFIEEKKAGLSVTLFSETTLQGSAGTVLANRNWVSNEQAFWIFYADVLTTTNLDEMFEFHSKLGQIATIGVYEVADPTRCGIVQVDKSGIVSDFAEKPKLPVGNLAFSGLMLATPELLDKIPCRTPVDFGFDVLPTIVGRTAAYRISDFIIDIGTLATYQAAQAHWPGLCRDSNVRYTKC